MRSEVFRNEMRHLMRLAIPLAAAQAGTQLMGLVDVAVLGRLGAVELAASGLGNAVFFAFSIVGMGIVLGVDPLVSQAIGAGDHLRARRVFWQGVWVALVLSAILTVVLTASSFLLPMIGAKAELIDPAKTYLLVRVTGIVPYLLFFVARSYLQALGVTRPLIVAMVVANIFNVAADIVLVFGGAVLPWWAGPLRLIPPLGVGGAALATVLCSILQLGIVAAAVRAVRLPVRVSHRWSGADVRQAFRVGTPVGLQMGAEVGIFALVGILASRIGTLDLAAHQLVIGLASFTFTVALGVAAAGSVRVGLAIGARDAAGTRVAGHVAFIGGGAVMGVAALGFALFPGALARMVTNQESVIAASIPLLMVAAVFQLSDGIQAVGAGVLRGAADTRFAFIANLIGHWLIGLPVALYLGFARQMGIVGLWWGLCAGLTAVAVLLFIRFERRSGGLIAPVGDPRIVEEV
jgi:multidrug resistance protein, MATE family